MRDYGFYYLHISPVREEKSEKNSKKLLFVRKKSFFISLYIVKRIVDTPARK